jgi:deoxyribodipyrimidine photo-lyase
MKTIIVWFRNDLRIADHPALYQAIADADRVIPLFVLDPKLLHGSKSSSNRNRFLLECLTDLRVSLQKKGGDLVVRTGQAPEVLQELASEYGAASVYWTCDYTPYATRRDEAIMDRLRASSISVKTFPGRLILDSPLSLTNGSGEVYKVFTPFWRAWLEIPRRTIIAVPTVIALPSGISVGLMPSLGDLMAGTQLSEDVIVGGETAGQKRLQKFIDGPVTCYHEKNNHLADPGTSRLSAYLHFGCISPRHIESMLPSGLGPDAWRRQLCWRDFYHYIILASPQNAVMEFQPRYRGMHWDSDMKLLRAWQDGLTGYPIVDAAMRQLKREGWIHNRGRLIVGSFLTKDLWLDWRLGETYFMKMLLDGDEANNNGNWQWIASVGVDPAPVFRRLFNPTRQHEKFDPDNRYVRRYVPELANVPAQYMTEPWTMPQTVQENSGCVIGQDYPVPIVDHKLARQSVLDRFSSL